MWLGNYLSTVSSVNAVAFFVANCSTSVLANSSSKRQIASGRYQTCKKSPKMVLKMFQNSISKKGSKPRNVSKSIGLSLQMHSLSWSQFPDVCPKTTQLAEQAVSPKVHRKPASVRPKAKATIKKIFMVRTSWIFRSDWGNETPSEI